MGILSSLFGSKKNEPEMEPVFVKVPTKPVVEPTIKESLANLAVEVIGVSERTALIPLQEDNISIKYAELVKIGLENSANAKVLKKQLDNINEQLFEKVIKSREITCKIIGKSISELTEEELDAKSTMAGTFISTDSVSVNKEIKYLKIGEEFDGYPIFYIDPKKRYIVTCYNHFIIYVIKSGYSTNASGKFNQIY